MTNPFELTTDASAIDLPLVSSPSNSFSPTSIYNLSGRQLLQPQPGVNIVGGKKVLVRPNR